MKRVVLVRKCNTFMQRRLLQSFVALQRKMQLRNLHCSKEQLAEELERLGTIKFDSSKRKTRKPEQQRELDLAGQSAAKPGWGRNTATRSVSKKDQKSSSRRKQEAQGARENHYNSALKDPKLHEFAQVSHFNHTIWIALSISIFYRTVIYCIVILKGWFI